MELAFEIIPNAEELKDLSLFCHFGVRLSLRLLSDRGFGEQTPFRSKLLKLIAKTLMKKDI